MFHHAVKACVCCAALFLGCAGSFADTYETIRTGKAGNPNISNFFVKGVGFAQLPYELGTVAAGHYSDSVFSRRQDLSGLFRKLNILPEVSVLEINGIGFQRELETTTVLDAARAHVSSNDAIFAFDGQSSEPARITLSVGDASVASLSAISVDELQPSSDGDAAEEVVASLPPDATDAEILRSDAAAESDLQSFQNGGQDASQGGDASGEVGSFGNSSLIDRSFGAPIAASGTLIPGSVSIENNDSGATTSEARSSANGGVSSNSGGDPVLVAKLPDDLGASPSIDVELEPVSLESADGSADGNLSDVPVPAALPLLATVLAGLGVMSVRRSRKSI